MYFPVGLPSDASNDDLRSLRQTTLPLVATPAMVLGWAWLTYVLVMMGGSLEAAWILAPACLLVGGALALVLSQSQRLAALVLLSGLAAASFLQSWQHFAGVWPYVFVLVVAVTGLLLRPVTGLISALPSGILIVAAGRLGALGPVAWNDIAPPIILVVLTAAVSFLAARNLYNALDWAWQNSLLAQQRLEEARDRQEELNRTLHTLDDTYELLQRSREEEAVARLRAEEGQRLKSRFASTVSHELRTPLNAIIGFSELMHSAPEVYGDMTWPPALRSDVNEVYRNAAHLQRLIDDILDLAQVDAMRMELTEEDVDLGQLVRDTLAAAAGLVRNKDVTMEANVPAVAPHLYADPTRIRQVLLNLLSNACRFTEHGRVAVSVTVEAHDVRVSVSDTGIGMTPQQLRRAFREFEQADASLRRTHGGTGLGLAISKRFVELHRGRIWAESEPGRGTTVHFTLPLSDSPAGTQPPGRVAVAGRTGETPQEKVVVLQGGPTSGRRLLARYCGGYRFVASADAAESAALVNRLHPWAVVVAAEAPLAAQFVVDSLRAQGRSSVPVISYATHPADSADLAQGVEWFTKPVKRAELLSALQRVAPRARSILVVDDTPADLHLLAQMLHSAEPDYEVKTAAGGNDALQMLSRETPDMVLLDLIMPDVGGLQVVDYMRGNPALAAIPVFMVTAGDVATEYGPLRAPKVQRLAAEKGEELTTQDWLAGVRALLDAVSPRYVADAGNAEPSPAGQRG